MSPAPAMPSPVTVPTLQDRAGPLAALGWTGREAEWIALVALHSGVFTRSQCGAYFEAGDDRKRIGRFVHALIDQQLAIEDERAIFPGGARAVTSRRRRLCTWTPGSPPIASCVRGAWPMRPCGPRSGRGPSPCTSSPSGWAYTRQTGPRPSSNAGRSSIVEGVSVFLSLFDLPSVARVFCPPAPEARPCRGTAEPRPTDQDGHELPALPGTALSGDLPPLDHLIERGKVLALNMPAGTNPALARAIGVMLKNAWLQSLLRRPATMQAEPDRYVRPAVFICDEYQAFASVGEDDPSGDEKAFALTRQCRVIPIVATQSISSLRSVLGSSEAWRTLLQTLRTRIFLSLSDEASAEIASKLCGQVAKIKSSYTINESSRQSGVNLLSAQAGGGRGSVGASKSFQERREALFQPRDFALLGNCQAICLPYDGVQSLPPRRVYLKPHYLPADLPYWTAKQTGQL